MGPFSPVAGQDLNLRPLGYEPYDVHLCRLVRSPVAAVTLAYGVAHVCVKVWAGGSPALVQGTSCRVPRRQ